MTNQPSETIDTLTGKLIKAQVEIGALRTQLNTMKACNAMLTERAEHWEHRAKHEVSLSDMLVQRNTMLIIEIDGLRERIKRLED